MATIIEEKWRPVVGFENDYEVSNLGRLRNVLTNKVLSIVNRKGDYLSYVLRSSGKRKSVRLHRIVYEAFVGNIPCGKHYHIHHVDGNKQNNVVSNLLLVDAQSHRFAHAKDMRAWCSGMNNYNKYIRPKKIRQLSVSGIELNIFNNAKEASLHTGVCSRNILQVARKEAYNAKGYVRKQAGGYVWAFVE